MPAPTSDGSRVAIAILAAGRGSRLDPDGAAATPKPLTALHDRPLLAHALDAAQGAAIGPVLVVTGYRGDEVAAAVDGRGDQTQVVTNPRWGTGIASSLVAALDHLDVTTTPAEVTAVCVGLADQPEVGPEAYRRLAAAHRDGAELAVATYDGQRGNPVLLSRSLWPKAQQLSGDVGARALMRTHPVVEVPCDGTGSAVDVDTDDDLRRLQAHENARDEATDQVIDQVSEETT